MPSPKAVLADIHDYSLDPNTEYDSYHKSGRLKVKTAATSYFEQINVELATATKQIDNEMFLRLDAAATGVKLDDLDALLEPELEVDVHSKHDVSNDGTPPDVVIPVLLKDLKDVDWSLEEDEVNVD